MLIKIIKRLSIGLFILIAVLSMLYFFVVRDNFHEVIPGKVYRSAQLSAEGFRHFIKEYHIRSIINLRGANPKRKWYQNEIRVSKELGIHHYNVRISAYHLPNPAHLRELVRVLQEAPEPILIHCEGGSDRSGLASAIILILKGDSLKQAEQQYSWEYLVYSKHSVGKLVIPIYLQWLHTHNLQNNRQHFLQWIAER